MDALDEKEVRERVQKILDELINPAIAGHGGWVDLLDVKDPATNEVIVPADSYLDENMIELVESAGVQSVKLLRMYETDLRTGEQAAQPTEGHLQIGADELVASGRHFVRVVMGG